MCMIWMAVDTVVYIYIYSLSIELLSSSPWANSTAVILINLLFFNVLVLQPPNECIVVFCSIDTRSDKALFPKLHITGGRGEYDYNVSSLLVLPMSLAGIYFGDIFPVFPCVGHIVCADTTTHPLVFHPFPYLWSITPPRRIIINVYELQGHSK